MKWVGRCVAIVSVMLVMVGPAAVSAGAGKLGGIFSAARFTLEVDGQTLGFSELSNISMGVEPHELIYAGTNGAIEHTKQYGKTKPPTVTLKNGFDTNQTLWAWHLAAQAGSPKARRTVLLDAVTGAGGQIFTWELYNAWPSKIEVSGLKAGSTETTVVTVTFRADLITTAPSGQSSVGIGSVSRTGKVQLAKGVPNPTTPHGTPAVLNGVSCASSTACAAVGRELIKSRNQPLVEWWNGSAWSTQSAPMPAGAVGAVLNGVSCVSASQCEAVGAWRGVAGAIHTLAEAWNGSAWAVQSSLDVSAAPSTVLTGISCASAASCEAVGYAAGPKATLAIAESQTGNAWRLQTVPRPPSYGTSQTRFSGVSCTSSTACLAVGVNGGRPFAAAFDGVAWTLRAPAVPAGAASASLSSVSCVAGGGCTAVGSLSSAAGGGRALAERWSGVGWTVEAVPHPAGTGASTLGGVSCASAGSCTAVGSIVNPSVGRKLLVYDWNGSAWSKIASPNPAGEALTAFNSVACSASASCLAVGGANRPSVTALMQVLGGS